MSLKPEFVALLRTNDIPLESTIREVKESLKAPLIELQEIEIEIQRLCELVETMKIKRETIQKRIDDHNVILAPVRRLPLDVLHEIFFHCLPTHRNPIMKSSESPILLTRICRSWRAVALSSPRIWSKIHIPLPGDPSSSTGYGIITEETTLSSRRQRYSDLLQLRCDVVWEWLSRSGTCPLSFSITYPPSQQNPKDDELPDKMFNILLSFAGRWRDVDISMPEEIYNKLQGDMRPNRFSSLNSLRLNLQQPFPTNNVKSPPIQLLAAPNLCSITISAFQTTLHITGSVVQPIWNQLTHITFTSWIADTCLLTLLRQCRNLVFGKFMVTSSHWPDESNVDQEDTALPCLESLTVNDSGSHEIMTIIFNSIKAPALTKLSYYWTISSPYDRSTILLPAPMIPLLSNSALITDLSLDGELSSQDTQECLRRGERVTHLVFGKPPPTDPSGHIFYPPFFDQDVLRLDNFDLKLLSIGPSSMAPLPKLESLEAYNLASLADEDLLALITSRIDAFKRGEIAALKSVEIYFQRRRQKDITEEVSRVAKEAGIEVKLDLIYPPDGSRFFARFSPSFGLTSNDCMWSSEII